MSRQHVERDFVIEVGTKDVVEKLVKMFRKSYTEICVLSHQLCTAPVLATQDWL